MCALVAARNINSTCCCYYLLCKRENCDT